MRDEQDKLRREIAVLLEQIGRDGLLFLKKQASTIIYNTTVQEMNQKSQESLLQNRTEKTSATTDKRKGTVISSRDREIFIDMSGKDKGFCNIVCGKVRVFFPMDELDSLVYIAKKASAQGDGGLLLYRWLKRERGDFLVDNGIKSYPSDLLDVLAGILRDL